MKEVIEKEPSLGEPSPVIVRCFRSQLLVTP